MEQIEKNDKIVSLNSAIVTTTLKLEDQIFHVEDRRCQIGEKNIETQLYAVY